MFYRSGNVHFLYTVYDGRCHNAGYEWIFRMVLEVTSAARISMDVNSWCQPNVYIVLVGFAAKSTTKFHSKLRIPGRGKHSAGWVNGNFCVLADTNRTIGPACIRDTTFRKVTDLLTEFFITAGKLC